jgi:hypothetical protein
VPVNREAGLKRIHMVIYEDDDAWYAQHFGGTTGKSKAMRTILRNYRKMIEAKVQLQAKALNPDEVMADMEGEGV